MKCPRCGNEVVGNFCNKCGLDLRTANLNNKKKKKSGCFIAVIVVLCIIVAFFVLIGLIGSLSDDDSVASQSNVSSEEQKTPLEEKGYVEKGDSFESDTLKITVDDVSTDFTDYDNEYGFNSPSDGMKYIMASFTYENIGEEGDVYASIYDFDCFADNASCEQAYGLDDSNFMNVNLSPGRNVSFKVYFQVPVNSQSIDLEYKESVWNDNRVKIKIQ